MRYVAQNYFKQPEIFTAEIFPQARAKLNLLSLLFPSSPNHATIYTLLKTSQDEFGSSTHSISTHTVEEVLEFATKCKYEYEIEVDPLQDDKATEIVLQKFGRPHMRAFHASWISFFMAFVAWFSIAPILPTIRVSANAFPIQCKIHHFYFTIFYNSICFSSDNSICSLIPRYIPSIFRFSIKYCRRHSGLPRDRCGLPTSVPCALLLSCDLSWVLYVTSTALVASWLLSCSPALSPSSSPEPSPPSQVCALYELSLVLSDRHLSWHSSGRVRCLQRYVYSVYSVYCVCIIIVCKVYTVYVYCITLILTVIPFTRTLTLTGNRRYC